MAVVEGYDMPPFMRQYILVYDVDMNSLQSSKAFIQIGDDMKASLFLVCRPSDKYPEFLAHDFDYQTPLSIATTKGLADTTVLLLREGAMLENYLTKATSGIV